MASARASILIERPAPEVYAFIADDFTRNYRRWSPEVQRLELLTPGPLRVRITVIVSSMFLAGENNIYSHRDCRMTLEGEAIKEESRQ